MRTGVSPLIQPVGLLISRLGVDKVSHCLWRVVVVKARKPSLGKDNIKQPPRLGSIPPTVRTVNSKGLA